MNDNRMNDDQMNDDRRRPDTDVLGELIRRAGHRENPSEDEYERVFAAASVALDAKIGRRRRRAAIFGIAATLLLGAGIALIVANRPTPPAQALAELDRLLGPAEIRATDPPAWKALSDAGAPLVANTRVRTGPSGRIGLLMTNGVSLRLAEATEVRFVAQGRVELVTGKIYVDADPDFAGAGADGPRIVVETGADTTWDVGTQFELLYTADFYRLRVREGHVHLKRRSRELDGGAGEQLTIDAAQNVQRGRIAADDPEWRWTESVAPHPDIDAWPVSALLHWVARQTGRKVAYAEPGLALKAETTMLYGSVQFLEPLQALETLLATTDFDYTLLEDGTILIDSR